MNFLFGNRLCSKTFKPRKNIPEHNKYYDMLPETAPTLGSGDLRLAVRLPEGEDLHEWIAINTVDFFNQINMLYGTLVEFCTEQTCPIMSAGPKYEYHWADGQIVKKPLKCSAPHYIDCLMVWIQKQLENESIFPSKIGAPFPRDFLNVVKVILKRLFRVYAHIYYQHFSEVRDLQEEAHLNTSFKHFIFFVLEFNLVQKRELAPLQQLIDVLTGRVETKSPHSIESGGNMIEKLNLPTSVLCNIDNMTSNLSTPTTHSLTTTNPSTTISSNNVSTTTTTTTTSTTTSINMNNSVVTSNR